MDIVGVKKMNNKLKQFAYEEKFYFHFFDADNRRAERDVLTKQIFNRINSTIRT